MKKTVICLIAAAAVSASCMKDENPIRSSENNELVAKIEQMASSKTYIDEDRNVLWSAGDQISAFMKTTLMTQYQVADESVGKPSARFTKVAKPESDDLYAGTPLEHNVVYYPYQEDLQCMMSDGNYTMSLSLPAVRPDGVCLLRMNCLPSLPMEPSTSILNQRIILLRKWRDIGSAVQHHTRKECRRYSSRVQASQDMVFNSIGIRLRHIGRQLRIMIAILLNL